MSVDSPSIIKPCPNCRPMSPSSPSRACTSSPMLAPATFPPLSMTSPSHTPATALPSYPQDPRRKALQRPSPPPPSPLPPHHLRLLLNCDSNPSPIPRPPLQNSTSWDILSPFLRCPLLHQCARRAPREHCQHQAPHYWENTSAGDPCSPHGCPLRHPACHHQINLILAHRAKPHLDTSRRRHV